jgi:hypothetical protein
LTWNWRKNTPAATMTRRLTNAIDKRLSILAGFLKAAVFIALAAMVAADGWCDHSPINRKISKGFVNRNRAGRCLKTP